MPIILPESLDRPASEVPEAELTPQEIVAELDKYIIGQKAAKKAVAIALRNRYRRRKLPPDLADEIAPKNILMIGPTGVGKTEISRRLAKLTCSPFLKIEASKFTEVGYVGRARPGRPWTSASSTSSCRRRSGATTPPAKPKMRRASTTRAKSCGPSSARGSSTTAWSIWR
jgi:hypothetical protein